MPARPPNPAPGQFPQGLGRKLSALPDPPCRIGVPRNCARCPRRLTQISSGRPALRWCSRFPCLGTNGRAAVGAAQPRFTSTTYPTPAGPTVTLLASRYSGSRRRLPSCCTPCRCCRSPPGKRLSSSAVVGSAPGQVQVRAAAVSACPKFACSTSCSRQVLGERPRQHGATGKLGQQRGGERASLAPPVSATATGDGRDAKSPTPGRHHRAVAASRHNQELRGSAPSPMGCGWTLWRRMPDQARATFECEAPDSSATAERPPNRSLGGTQNSLPNHNSVPARSIGLAIKYDAPVAVLALSEDSLDPRENGLAGMTKRQTQRQ